LSGWERITENSRAAIRYVSFGYMTVENGLTTQGHWRYYTIIIGNVCPLI